jgi:hypothetical protein
MNNGDLDAAKTVGKTNGEIRIVAAVRALNAPHTRE